MTKRDFHFTAFERNISRLTYLFLLALTVFDWKINENSCSRAELQVVVSLSLYELSREREVKRDRKTMTVHVIGQCVVENENYCNVQLRLEYNVKSTSFDLPFG